MSRAKEQYYGYWMVEYQMPAQPITFIFCHSGVQAENLAQTWREAGAIASAFWDMNGPVQGGSHAGAR